MGRRCWHWPKGLAAKVTPVVMVAIDGKPAGVLDLADTVKSSAVEALAGLRAEGLRLVMLTGDHRASGQAIAKELGIAGCWPR